MVESTNKTLNYSMKQCKQIEGWLLDFFAVATDEVHTHELTYLYVTNIISSKLWLL